MNQKLPEILAPAGSYDIMVQAFQAGADAVYLGGHQFGARAYASNLSEEELIQAIEYTQLHHKRIYLTVNTLLKDKEIDRLSAFLRAPYEAGLNGVIVQDIGAASMIRHHFPDMELHASTQMCITSPSGANALKQLGIVRVVPARELSLEEIRAIKEETGLEVEVFVHGAFCYCYSGQCLLSSMIGGRSGNRGRCAQPCRQKYQAFNLNGTMLSDKPQYYLSMRDLCGLKSVPALIELGVDSFKIEGRMKKAEYVIAAVSSYRKAVDAYFGNADKDTTGYSCMTEQNRLADVYNRGDFTSGYFRKRNGPDMMAMERNNHNGICLGVVSHIAGGEFTVQLTHHLNEGDVLEVRTQHGKTIELTSGTVGDAGGQVRLKGKEMKLMQVGDQVYRTKNHVLCDELIRENAASVLKENLHISLRCKKDLPVIITMRCGDNEVSVAGSCAQKAEKQPLTKADIETKLRKLSDTPFQIATMEIHLEPDCFFSMKELNRLRHQAMELLEEKCRKQHTRTWKPVSVALSQIRTEEAPVKKPELAVYVSTKEQFGEVLAEGTVSEIGIETEKFTSFQITQMISDIRTRTSGQNNKIRIILALPHIYRLDMRYDMLEFMKLPADGYLVRTMDELALLREQDGCTNRIVKLDASVYTYNREAAAFMTDRMQASSITLPVEYSKEDLQTLLRLSPNTMWDFILYGKQVVMVSAQCTYKNLGLCRNNHPPFQQRQENGSILDYNILLKNEFQDEFHVERICKYCYNVIYQNKPNCYFQMLQELRKNSLGTLRIQLTDETPQEVSRLLHNQTPKNSGQGRFRKGIE